MEGRVLNSVETSKKMNDQIIKAASRSEGGFVILNIYYGIYYGTS